MSNPASIETRLATGYGAFRRRRFSEALLVGLAATLPSTVAGLALAMPLRYHLAGAWIGPVFTLIGVAAGAWLGWRHWRRVAWGFEGFLRHVERASGIARNELLNALDLSRRLPDLSDPLTRGLALQAIDLGDESLSRVRFAELARSRSLRRPAWQSAAAGLVAALLLVVAPEAFRDSAARLLRPGARQLPPALTFRVEPGNATIERGETVRVRAVVPARLEGAELVYRGRGGAWKVLPMATVGTDGAAGDEFRSFGSEVREVMEATEYAVSAGGQRSEVYRLDVVDPLRATGYEKRVVPPAYTGLAPSQTLEADGHLDVLAGSQVSLGIQTTRRDVSGRIVWADGRAVPLVRQQGDRPAMTFTARESGEYRVELSAEGAASRGAWLSDPFRVEVTPDRHPTLAQIAPGPSLQLPPEMTVELRAECLDDFGLTRLDLVSQRNDREPERETLARWNGERDATVSHVWDLEGVLLTPGDRVRYHLELTDNDGFSGPKTTRGPECEIVFPTLEEMFAAQEEDREEQVGSVTEMLSEQRKLKEELRRSAQELRASKKLGWEEQEKLRELAGRQEKVAESIDKLAESLDQSLSRMEQAEMFSPEMAQKVEEIGELVRQIQSPAFREQMQKMREAMQKLDRRALEQAMEKLQLSQEELERSLDRTLEMLKQLLAEERLEQLIQQAEELAQEQSELNREMGEKSPEGGKPPDSEQQSAEDQQDGEQQDGEQQDGEQQPEAAQQAPLTPEEAKALQEKQQALAEELRKLQEELQKLRQENQQQLSQMNQEMEKRESEQQLQSAEQNMKSAQQQMGQCNKSEGLKFGRQAKKDLEEFAEEMRQAQQQARADQQEEITKRLFALSGQLVTMSKSQEALLQEAPSQSTRELAVTQARLSDSAKKTMEQLAEVGRLVRVLSHDATREMSNAVRELEGATRAFEQGDRSEAMGQGRASTNSMNETVLALLETNDKMCQMQAAGSCSNPMSQMRGLSSQQQQLNDQGQQMLGGGGQGRLSPSGSQGEKLAQMAARQEMIRQGLSELEQSMGEDSGMLGRLGDLGEEMEEIARQLREEGFDQRLLERQERILSRLLTAQRSLRKEDSKEERMSRTGENPLDRESPGALDNSLTALERMRRSILRGSQDPVPAEYRRLVEEYFRSLADRP